ncbi:MAG TPA: FAD-binding dehydrogenase [Clostridiales bacterium]|nr:FAD-binding dehydrogenase [Clostridiales bacterium]
MSKEISRREFVKGLAVSAAGVTAIGLFGGCGNGAPTTAATPTAAAGLYTPGTYTATAKGMESDITVTMTFDASSITDITLDVSGETESIGAAAGDTLKKQLLAAQSSQIDGVSGASVTSAAVKQAAADCISQASGGKIVQNMATTPAPIAPEAAGNDWLGTAPEIAESDIKDTLETEVLIVGASNGGLAAGARAAQCGAAVLVIEKAISSMNEREALGAIGTRAAKAAGIETDKNLVVAELCRYASHRCNEKLIRLWADRSGEMLDWLEEIVTSRNDGVSLHIETDIGKGGHDNYYIPVTWHNFQDSDPSHDYTPATGAYSLRSLSAVISENGGEIRYSTPMVKLERETGGRVTGVIAKNENGEYIRINASKGVILCTGGYAGNQAMLKALNPVAYNCTVQTDSTPNCFGDGIKAGMWVGADKDPDATVMLFDRGTIQPDRLVDGDWKNSGYFHLGSQPWLKVNLNGERFCNESVPYDFILHAAYMEPHHLYNTVYDSNWVDQVKQFKQFACARIEPSPDGGKWILFNWDAEKGLLATLQQAGFIQQADTLEELAEKLNMPADTFVETVKRYNALCDKGVDEDFGKEAYRLLPLNTPPYFGCRQGANLLTTLDGLRINTNMQVLDTEGKVIDGLYAAGDCSGGFFAHNYPEYIAGVAVGRTLTEGYLAGEYVAKL